MFPTVPNRLLSSLLLGHSRRSHAETHPFRELFLRWQPMALVAIRRVDSLGPRLGPGGGWGNGRPRRGRQASLGRRRRPTPRLLSFVCHPCSLLRHTSSTILALQNCEAAASLETSSLISTDAEKGVHQSGGCLVSCCECCPEYWETRKIKGLHLSVQP